LLFYSTIERLEIVEVESVVGERKREEAGVLVFVEEGRAANQRSLEDAPSNMPPRVFRLKAAANQLHSIMPPRGIIEVRHRDISS
jgi:hypothetical protein